MPLGLQFFMGAPIKGGFLKEGRSVEASTYNLVVVSTHSNWVVENDIEVDPILCIVKRLS